MVSCTTFQWCCALALINLIKVSLLTFRMLDRKICVRVYVFHLPSTTKICLQMKQNIFVKSMHKRFFDIFDNRCFDIFDTIFLGLRRMSFFALYLFPIEICVKCHLWSCTISAEWGLKYFMNTSRYKPVLFKTLLPITVQ